MKNTRKIPQTGREGASNPSHGSRSVVRDVKSIIQQATIIKRLARRTNDTLWEEDPFFIIFPLCMHTLASSSSCPTRIGRRHAQSYGSERLSPCPT